MISNFFFCIANIGVGFAVTLVASVAALGCSMAVLPEKPRSIVNPGVYILVGEVVGYTEPVSDPANFRGKAVGLKLKLVESIHFPYFQNDFVELFMFGHGTDCFPEGHDYRPPIGTKYRLALGAASHMTGRGTGGRIRLESNVFSRIGIDEAMFGFATTAKSEFDYKKDLRTLADKFSTSEMAEKRRWLNDFLYIEASKDLLRLSRATSENERMRILERLLYCPNINYNRLFFSEVGKPLQNEEGLNLIVLSENSLKKVKRRKFSSREKELLTERIRLESSGELNLWKN